MLKIKPLPLVSKYTLRTNKQLANMLKVRAYRLRGTKGPNVMTDYLLLMESSERLRGLK